MKRATVLMTILALLLSLAIGLSAVSGQDPGGESFTIPERQPQAYPVLGSHLNRMVASVEAGSLSPSDAAANSPVHSAGSVAVTIWLSGNVDGVVAFLAANGGAPRNVGEDYIEAYVPVTLLASLSQQPGVIRVREIVPPQPDYGNSTSQGVQVSGATAWHDAGYRGDGIKVGIIDNAFAGLSELLGQELPTAVNVRCYTDYGVTSSNLAACGFFRGYPIGSGQHGTASAETVADYVPEASFYITNPRSHADMRDAVEWLIAEEVSVINASISWQFDGPGDGTSPWSDGLVNTVDLAVGAGIVWVNSAGNSARHTWYGPFLDTDSDGFLNFQDSEERNFLRIDEGRTLLDYSSYSIELRWEDDWVLDDGAIGGATSDLDVFVYDGTTNRLVASSDDPQSGAPGHIPRERIWRRHFSEPPTGSNYYIVVAHAGGELPDWVQLTLSHSGPTLQHHTLHGSIKNPAEGKSPGMLAVGAAHWNTVETIKNYSSRGPAPDGRIKPEVVGATSGDSVSYPDHGYGGTSGASPNVAGLAALVRQKFPQLTPIQVAQFLKDHAQQRESPDPNNTWGHGFALLPDPATATPPDNIPPAFDEGDQSHRTVAENSPPGTPVGLPVRATDLDGDALTYTLSGPDAASFDLDGGSGQILVRDALDYETKSQYFLVVSVTDGKAADNTPDGSVDDAIGIAVSVTDVDEAPPDPCAPDAITENGDYEGAWDSDCESAEDGRGYARYYTFELTEQADVAISLESSDTDTYLYLRNGARDGAIRLENDDHAGADLDSLTDSHIQADGLPAGEYTIEATTYKPGEGKFTLTVAGLPGGGSSSGPRFSRLAGPSSGHFHHDPGDNRVEIDDVDVDAYDVFTWAEFENPYAASEHPFSFGFRLRVGARGDDNPYAVVHSDGEWAIRVDTDAGGETIHRGPAPSLRTGQHDVNELSVWAEGEYVRLWLNDVLLTKSGGEDSFRLGENAVEGDVWIVAGFWSGTERSGAITHYDNFTVYELISAESGTATSGTARQSIQRLTAGYAPPPAPSQHHPDR